MSIKKKLKKAEEKLNADTLTDSPETIKAEITETVQTKVVVDGSDESSPSVKDTVWGNRAKATAEKFKELNKYTTFDPEKHKDYPLVKVGDNVILPVGVFKFNGGLASFIKEENPKHMRVLNTLISVAFGYRGRSSESEVEKLFRGKTYYHFKLETADLYLTDSCSISVDHSYRSVSGMLIADGLKTESLSMSGFTLCLSKAEIKAASTHFKNSFVFMGGASIDLNQEGLITKIKHYNYKDFDCVGGSISAVGSIYAGKLKTGARIDLNNSIMINSDSHRAKIINLRNTVLLRSLLNAESCYLDDAKLDECNLSAKNININLEGAELTHRYLSVSTTDIWITHSIGLGKIEHPLLPEITVVTLPNSKMAITTALHFKEGPIIDFTDGKWEIEHTLSKWMLNESQRVLTDIEAKELSEILFSRVTVLRALANLENSKRSTRYFPRYRLPFSTNIAGVEINDDFYVPEIGDF